MTVLHALYAGISMSCGVAAFIGVCAATFKIANDRPGIWWVLCVVVACAGMSVGFGLAATI